jgi:hypothetical protein
MRQPFAMLVEHAVAVSRPEQGIVLTGPSIGTPEVGQVLTIRGAFSRPARQRLRGIVRFHRSASPSRTGIVVALGQASPETFRGAVVYEEGFLFRVFSGFTNAPHLRASAHYQLRDGVSEGFVHVEKGIINAFVIGGGLPEGDSLWQELVLIDYGNGSLLPRDIQPVSEGWLVPVLHMYGLADASIMVTPPCGPATMDFPLLVYRQAAAFTEGRVIMQQASGIVQVNAEMKFSTVPRALSPMVWNYVDVN